MPTVALPDLLELASRERPFTVEEYHALARAGVLTEDDRVELLDGRIKHPRYAAAGIPEYWIVDVNDGTVTVHRRPSADGYAEVVRHARGDEVSMQALPDVPPLSVQDIVEA